MLFDSDGYRSLTDAVFRLQDCLSCINGSSSSLVVLVFFFGGSEEGLWALLLSLSCVVIPGCFAVVDFFVAVRTASWSNCVKVCKYSDVIVRRGVDDHDVFLLALWHCEGVGLCLIG